MECNIQNDKKRNRNCIEEKREVHTDIEDRRKIGRFSREIFGGKEEFKAFEGKKKIEKKKKEGIGLKNY